MLHEFEVANRASSVHLIRSFVSHEISRLPLSPEAQFDLLTAVGEAADNAVLYGQSVSDAPNVVKTRLSWNDRSVCIELTDSGPGFRPDISKWKLPDPMSEHGRGVYLMKTLVDVVSYPPLKSGTTCVLTKTFDCTTPSEPAIEIGNAREAARGVEPPHIYRSLIENAVEGIWVIDADGVTTFVNERMAKMLGYPVQRMLGRRMADFTREEDGTRTEEARRRWEAGMTEQLEQAFVRRDGKLLHALVAVGPLYDERGRFCGALGLVSDVTERRRAEEALAESERKYRVVADNTYDWEFWRAPEGHYLYVSPSCERITGYSPHEFQGDPELIRRIVHEEDREAFDDHIREVEKSRGRGRATASSWRIRHKNGGTRWIEHVCRPVFSEHGEYMGTRGSNRDVTERLEAISERREALSQAAALNEKLASANESLTALRQELEAILEGMNEPLLAWDKSGRVALTNPAVRRLCHCELAGMSRSQLIRSLRVRRPHGRLLKPAELAGSRAAEEGGTVAEEEVWIETPQGEHRIVLASATPLEHDELTSVVLLRDVTDERRLAEQRDYLASYPETNPNPVGEIGDGTIKYMNPELRRLFPEVTVGDKPPLELQPILETAARLKKPRGGTIHEEIAIGSDWYRFSVFAPRKGAFRLFGFDVTDRRKAEQERERSLEELRTSQEILDAHAANSPLAIIQFDSAFRVTRWSDEAERVFGWKASEILGKAMGINRNYRKDGSVIWCEWYNSAIYDEQGKLVSVFSQVLDITERKAAEARLEQQAVAQDGVTRILQAALTANTEEELGEACLGVATELTGSEFGFIGEVGPDGLLHDVAMNETGWDACAMHDKSGHRRRPGDFKLHGLYGHVVTTGRSLLANTPSQHPQSIGTPEGHPRVNAFLGVPMNSEGRTIGMIGLANRPGGYTEEERKTVESIAPIVVEAFERKRADERVRESEERLSRSQEIAHLGSWELDVANNALTWSDEVYRIFGLKPREFEATYEAFLDHVHPEDRTAVDDAYTSSLREGRDSYEIEHRVLRESTGEVRFVHEKAQHYRDKAGNVARSLGMVHDITERKKAEEALRERRRLSEALNRVAEAIHGTLELDMVLHRAVVEAGQAIGSDSAAMSTREPGRAWLVRHGYGLDHDAIGTRTTDLQERHALLALETDRIVAIDDARSDPRVNKAHLRRWGVRSVLVVPIATRTEGVGVVFFNYARPHTFSDAELDFAGKLSSSLSLAVENSRLYESEHRIAEALQERLRPVHKRIAGIEFAPSYHSATETARVGGDFYDLFELEEGRVVMLVGDVSGKGVTAAGLTEGVRSAVRALSYGQDVVSPAHILTRVNDSLLRQMPPEQFVTAVLLLLDVKTGELTGAGAGHPDPVICGTSCRSLRLAAGPPLGSLPGEYEEVVETLNPSETLVAYTDGLTEARRGPRFYGEERLIALLSKLEKPGPHFAAEALVSDVMKFAEGKLQDDLVILAVGLARGKRKR